MQPNIIKKITFVDENNEKCSIILQNIVEQKTVIFEVFVIMERTNDIIIKIQNTKKWAVAKESFSYLMQNIENFLPISEITKSKILEN